MRAKVRCFTGVTLTQLESLGYHADECERRITSRLVKDLFGFADIIGFDADEVLLVQVTDNTHFANRVVKLLALQLARDWVAVEGRALEVWGWYTAVKYRRTRLALEDFLQGEDEAPMATE